MDKVTRARIISDYVLGLDERFRKIAPPRSAKTDRPSTIISDNCRFSARYSEAYDDDGAGKLWDLLELHIYGQSRMTIVRHGEEIKIRQYLPGVWEEFFLNFDPKDTIPLLPNWHLKEHRKS